MSKLSHPLIKALTLSLQILSVCLIFSHYQAAQAVTVRSCKDVLVTLNSLANLQNAQAISDGKKSFTIMSGNVENLKIPDLGEQTEDRPFQDYRTARQKSKGKRDFKGAFDDDVKFKPEWKVQSFRDEIAKHKPSFFVAQEVYKGNEAEQFLSEGKKPTLSETYLPLQIEGNDERGIQLTVFVRKDLGFEYKYETHKDLRWDDPATKENDNLPLFSRDLPILWVYVPGKSKPRFAIVPIHPKSKRDREGDPESVRWRTAQYVATGNIMQEEIISVNGEKFPAFVVGDFQTDIQTGPEMEPVRSLTTSAFDLVPNDKMIPVDDRVTHNFFGRDGRQSRQLDDIRVRGAVVVKNAQIIPHKDQNGNELPPPRNFKERSKQRSDHGLIMAEVLLEPEK